MPHSSGGGSHSGGGYSSSGSSYSHSGSSSSRSYSDNSSYSSYSGSSGTGASSYQKPNTMKTAKFSGAKRYVYFEDSKPVYVWANYDITKPIKTRKKITKFLVFMAFWLTGLLGSIHHPLKLFWTEEELAATDVRNPVIIDNANVLGETASLKSALSDFYKTTGICASVITAEDSKWINNYTALEHYAYDVYVNTFDDEKHWLILYSTPQANTAGAGTGSVDAEIAAGADESAALSAGNTIAGADTVNSGAGNSGTSESASPLKNISAGFEDWKWHGVQGDYTDPILTSHETDIFNQKLQKYLLQRDQYQVGEAIAQAFNDFNKVVMNTYIPTESIVGAVIALIIGILVFLFAFGGFHPDQEKVYKTAKLCPENFVDEDTCEYCGGVYSILLHKKCPHCGAPVKAHDYTTDKDGNITGILN